MPRIPNELQLPGLQPGSDPVVSPQRSIIRSTADVVQTGDTMIEHEKQEADRLGFLAGMSALERDVTEFMDKRANDKRARNNAGAFTEHFKDYPAAVAKGVAFSRRGQQQANIKARATLGLARSQMRRLDFERGKIDAATSIMDWIESSSTLAAVNQISRAEYESQVEEEYAKGIDSRHFDKNDELVGKRLALAKFEQANLSLLHQQGDWNGMNKFIKNEARSLSTEKLAGFRAASLGLQQAETVQYVLNQMMSNAEGALDSVMGANHLTGSQFFGTLTRVEAEKDLQYVSAAREFHQRDPEAQNMGLPLFREWIVREAQQRDVSTRTMLTLYAIANVEDAARRDKLMKDLEDRQTLEYENSRRGQRAVADLALANVAEVKLSIAEGRPDFRPLAGLSREGIKAMRASNLIDVPQSEELFKALTALMKSGTLNEQALDDMRRLNQLDSGVYQPVPGRSQDERLMKQKALLMLQALDDPNGEDRGKVYHVNEILFRKYGWITQDFALLLRGDLISDDAGRFAAAGNMAARMLQTAGGRQLENALKGQGMTNEEWKVMKESATEMSGGDQDFISTHQRVKSKVGWLKIPEERKPDIVRTLYMNGLTDPDPTTKTLRLDGEHHPIPDEDRNAQGFIPYYRDALKEYAEKSDNPDIKALADYEDDQLITRGDHDLYRQMGGNDVGWYNQRKRDIMRAEVRQGHSMKTAAATAVRVLVGGQEFGLDDLSASGPRLVRFPPGRSGSDIVLPFTGRMKRKEWMNDALAQNIYTGIRDLENTPKLAEQMFRSGITFDKMEPSVREQFYDALFKSGSNNIGTQIMAAVHAGTDQGDPDVRDGYALVLSSFVKVSDFFTRTGPQQTLRFIAGAAMRSQEAQGQTVDPLLRSYVNGLKEPSPEEYSRALADIERWKGSVARLGRMPARIEALDVQVAGEPTRYTIVFQSQEGSGHGFDRQLMQMIPDRETGELRLTDQPVWFTLKPEDSPKAVRFMLKNGRQEILAKMENRGVFDDPDAGIFDALSKDPLASDFMARDPAMRIDFAKQWVEKQLPPSMVRGHIMPIDWETEVNTALRSVDAVLGTKTTPVDQPAGETLRQRGERIGGHISEQARGTGEFFDAAGRTLKAAEDAFDPPKAP